jgi:hypothetical protein
VTDPAALTAAVTGLLAVPNLVTDPAALTVAVTGTLAL